MSILILPALVMACTRPTVVASPAPPPPPVGAAPPPPATVAPPAPPAGVRATATIFDVANSKVGSATFTDTPAGLLVTGTVTGLGLGLHAVHLHSIGLCQPGGFTSAGPHFNPSGAKHGFKNPAGFHAGDLPNIVSPPAGNLGFQFLATGVRLSGRNGLLDADGASIVFHSGEDDYLSDPAGNSSGRLACGVITLAK